MLRCFLSFLTGAVAVSSPVFAELPKKLLLIGQGPDGHPPQTHEYLAGVNIIEKCLKPVQGIEISVAKADGAWKEGPELIQRADAVVVFVSEGAKWLQLDERRIESLRAMAKRGGGIVVLHWGMGCKEANYIDPFVEIVGGCHGGPDRKYKEDEFDVELVDAKHPILTGIEPFKVKEEFYYQLKFVKPDGSVKPLLRATIDGNKETVCWAWERSNGGRSFGFSGLHFHANWKNTEYRRLVSQAVLWTLKLPVPASGLNVDLTEEDLRAK